ncbi:uncharacterized protein K452DRAFT_237200 [Aplosporella prunicola CBS 121167]|uniref:FAD-binding domain-containing protein n=1 Tax=Aplosporella prunicola CBS 121167 TaxID=1176127 RepID=A0A6A6B0P5_9PEZI|nr:uncharacterized protein K452DRAFT_237200 [Aplosporella prunicola CBS 121167]KAF2136597.1 hypothetical protein K452DRAFT_237200 [Aplosporella prunicola CBS 121167]
MAHPQLPEEILPTFPYLTPPLSPASPPPFHVLIVGASISGLALAHALQRAKIPHTILEAQPQVTHPGIGASIGLWPNGMRVLDQLGAWERIKKECNTMGDCWDRGDSGGTACCWVHRVDERGCRNGYTGFAVLERAHVVKALWDTLPDQSVVVTNARLANIVDGPDGVRVTTTSGAEYAGDIVVGCDGVNSAVRSCMWEAANRNVPGLISEKEKRSLITSYKCLAGISTALPSLPGHTTSDSHILHAPGRCILLLTTPTRTFFFVFLKLPRPIQYPARVRYTPAEAAAEAAALAHVPLTDTGTATFGDVWARRLRAQLIPLEEGVFDTWHHGRTVLLGDSAHKFSVMLAFGGNAALESAAALANCLHREVLAHRGCKVGPEAITNLFEEYQAQRFPRAQRIHRLAHRVMRLQSWETPLLRAAQRFVIPLVGEAWALNVFAALVAGGGRLNFVPVPEHEKGNVPFDDEIVRGALVRRCPGEAGSAALVKVTGMHERLAELLRVLLSAGLFAAVVVSVRAWRT